MPVYMNIVLPRVYLFLFPFVSCVFMSFDPFVYFGCWSFSYWFLNITWIFKIFSLVSTVIISESFRNSCLEDTLLSAHSSSPYYELSSGKCNSGFIDQSFQLQKILQVFQGLSSPFHRGGNCTSKNWETDTRHHNL